MQIEFIYYTQHLNRNIKFQVKKNLPTYILAILHVCSSILSIYLF